MASLAQFVLQCPDIRLHTLPGAPLQRMASREQIEAHYRNLEVLTADKIGLRFGLDPNPPISDPELRDYESFKSSCHHILVAEDNWQQSKRVWSWIDAQPVWVSPIHWRGILPDPDRPQLRQFRLSLFGGGQIRVTENSVPVNCNDAGRELELLVAIDAGDGLRYYIGVVLDCYCEMAAHVALFEPGTPQSVADRTVQTFRLLTNSTDSTRRGPDPDNFMALLDRSKFCCVCQHLLRDDVSTKLGICPDCARQWKLPHELVAANRILQRRKELFGFSRR